MVIEKAYAKLNLALEVVSKRDDGYHELKMIMIPLELHDTLTFKKSDDIQLNANVDIKNNAILKTIEYMKKKYKVNKGVFVDLDKRIPIGAGMGGGSADISATLRGLNQLWDLNLSLKDLEVDANNLGSDTLFCLYNKAAYVYGRGDKISFIDPIYFDDIFLFNPGIEVSTVLVFKHYKHEDKKRNFEQLLTYLKAKDYENFFKNTYNDLHKTAISLYKNLEKYEKNIKKVYKNAYMTGSGSTYFFINFDKNSKINSKILQKNELNSLKTRSKR